MFRSSTSRSDPARAAIDVLREIKRIKVELRELIGEEINRRGNSQGHCFKRKKRRKEEERKKKKLKKMEINGEIKRRKVEKNNTSGLLF